MLKSHLTLFIGNKQPQGDDIIRAIRNSISILLTHQSPYPLTESYEAIYNRCRLIVCVSNKGEGLYGALKMELEKCTKRVLDELLNCTQDGVEWIRFMVQLCDWFHDAAVCANAGLSSTTQLIYT